MIWIVFLVAAFCRPFATRGRSEVGTQDPVARVEQLARLEEHLDDMLVARPPRTFSWIRMKVKDIHGAPHTLCVAPGFNFF